MTIATAEHPLVKTFQENGIEVTHYLDEEDGIYGLIEFDGNRQVADQGMALVRDSEVELRGLRYARYFDPGEPEVAVWEILFRSRQP